MGRQVRRVQTDVRTAKRENMLSSLAFSVREIATPSNIAALSSMAIAASACRRSPIYRALASSTHTMPGACSAAWRISAVMPGSTASSVRVMTARAQLAIGLFCSSVQANRCDARSTRRSRLARGHRWHRRERRSCARIEPRRPWLDWGLSRFASSSLEKISRLRGMLNSSSRPSIGRDASRISPCVN